MAFAELLNEEARELAALGVDVIQFDEPAFNVYLDDVVDWGIAALHRAAAGLACTTAVHICYGYGIQANIEWKETLGGEWRQYEQIFPALAASRIDQVSLECANSHVPIELMAAARRQGRAGRRDRRRDRRVETPEEVAATIERGAALRPGRSGCSPAPIAAWRRSTAVGAAQARGARRRRRAGARPPASQA